MSSFLPTIILRHRKENLKKCSLKGLESRSDCKFYTYPKHDLLFQENSLKNYILLDIDAPLLTKEEAHLGLFLIDGTWNYAQRMKTSLPPFAIRRSLPPHIKTAYPRKQTGCEDPNRGLASIEALYIAYAILGREKEGLLEHYHWKEAFLKNLEL